jgi:peptidoglycan/xylan/chitin deacetylase (PgdA/CDA1 family)
VEAQSASDNGSSDSEYKESDAASTCNASFETNAGLGCRTVKSEPEQGGVGAIVSAIGAFALPLPGADHQQLRGHSIMAHAHTHVHANTLPPSEHTAIALTVSLSRGTSLDDGKVLSGRFWDPLGEGAAKGSSLSAASMMPPPALPSSGPGICPPALQRSHSIKLTGIKLNRENSLYTPDLKGT